LNNGLKSTSNHTALVTNFNMIVNPVYVSWPANS